MMIYSPEYEDCVEKRIATTIGTLRQMRCAGETIQQKHWMDPQEILVDAERLVKSAAPYLVHFINGSHTSQMFSEWETELMEMKVKYHVFPQIRRSPWSVPLVGMRTNLLVMTMNEIEGLTNCFIRKNNLGNLTFPDLFDDTLGILAPLSTDILVASLLPEFICLHYSQKTPQVKPVLLDTDLRRCIFPKNNLSQPAFASATSKILAFVDEDATHRTRKALVSAVQQEYPGKVIPTGFP